jgi:hypothetical protein
MRPIQPAKRVRINLLILGALALAQGGCLAVAAGSAAAAAGGAAGYAYYSGKYYREYVANEDDVWAATQTAFKELQLPIDRAERGLPNSYIESQTGDGVKIHLSLEARKSPIPVEGSISKVSIRVGAFGDGTISERILDQIDSHLSPTLSPSPTTVAAPAPIAPTHIQVGGTTQTAPPPLLTDEKKHN